MHANLTDKAQFLDGLVEFLDSSPTPYHAVRTMSALLDRFGFQRLQESGRWSLQAGQGYYVTRNDSSIIAFRTAAGDPVESGMRLVGAHTDSPCLKIKPHPELRRSGVDQLAVEPYGGVLLAPWFDRDLSIAGRVTGEDGEGKLVSELVDFVTAVAVIPSLAIHLDRNVNDERAINRQRDILPVLCTASGGDSSPDWRRELLELCRRSGNSRMARVLDFDLCLYDTQGAAIVGMNAEFIASARLDNLLSCYTGLAALVASEPGELAVLVCNDHEEVGSVSACGANGPFLLDTLRRLVPDEEARLRTISRSLMVSVDNAHAVHPNFADRHDPNHLPLLNGGPVIKSNVNQRYATGSESAARFRQLCMRCEVPVQAFVARSDMGCGSTIGPITAGVTGLNTLDVGVPQWAMHSIRETAGSDDAFSLARVLATFFSEPGPLDVGLAD